MSYCRLLVCEKNGTTLAILFAKLCHYGAKAFDYLENPIEVDTLVDKIHWACSATVESSLMAGTFAEAGEFDTAKEYVDTDKQKRK